MLDRIPGKGKTSWAIQEINRHMEQSYIYVTPLLTEVERIKTCVARQFYEPTYNGARKIDSFNDLLCGGRNIATTHSTFSNADDETIDLISQGHYTLILDEVIDILEPYNDVCKDPAQKMKQEDVKLLKDKSLIDFDECGRVLWIGQSYQGSKFSEVERLAKRGNLIYLDGTLLYWEFPHELFSLFKEVYILTYLFDGSFLKPFLEYYDLGYRIVGVEHNGDEYCLVPHRPDNDERSKYQSLITVCNDSKLNNYTYNELSKSWYTRNIKSRDSKEAKRLRNNLFNFFRNKHSCVAEDIMWCCPKDYKKHLKGPGYTCLRKLTPEESKLPQRERERAQGKLSCFVPCNARATNDYKDRSMLAYTYNMYANPYIKRFFAHKEISVNEDMFALSCLLQWIWRSRVRVGATVNLYLPSPRMRGLLQSWLDGSI